MAPGTGPVVLGYVGRSCSASSGRPSTWSVGGCAGASGGDCTRRSVGGWTGGWMSEPAARAPYVAPAGVRGRAGTAACRSPSPRSCGATLRPNRPTRTPAAMAPSRNIPGRAPAVRPEVVEQPVQPAVLHRIGPTVDRIGRLPDVVAERTCLVDPPIGQRLQLAT